MDILITGAGGFLGSHLSRTLIAKGHRVTGVGRTAPPRPPAHRDFEFIQADTAREGDWQGAAAQADAVVNLAGKSIFGRWSAATKREIRDSRIQTTRHVAAAMGGRKPATLISASGIGYYGDRGDEPLSEAAAPGRGFLPQLTRDWEAEALGASAKGVRVVATRLAVVLGPGGGAMAQMIPAFKRFLGGPIGSGNQWFPWIHIDDLAAAVCFLLEREAIRGPVNLCAPNPVRQRDLARALGQALNRPAALPAPAFLIRLVLGEFGSVLLESQRALPGKLNEHRFAFRYPDIIQAVRAVVTGAQSPA
jgi:hypothetical protein